MRMIDTLSWLKHGGSDLEQLMVRLLLLLCHLVNRQCGIVLQQLLPSHPLTLSR